MRRPERAAADGGHDAGGTGDYMTAEEYDCPGCSYFGPLHATSDSVADVVALNCPRCGEIDDAAEWRPRRS